MNKSGTDSASLFRVASLLAVVTIAYNLLEGFASVHFGAEDDTLALFGFGLDSFVEIISGVGVWHMIQRIQRQPETDPDRFERTALRITGSAFCLLSIGLMIGALLNLYYGQKPETTLWGIVISLISISVMWVLIHYKVKAGRLLHSEAILADADCSRVCLWLSWILLLSSLGYELTGVGGMDAVGAMGIAVFSFREGREAFEKARGEICETCSCGKGGDD